jgi:gamma-glutamylcyclotransferase (GGCT)/AIG2-like uncharacterized protein YtfP
MNLFAYGTLIDPEIVRQVAGEVPRHVPATLLDHERKMVRGKPYPGIREQPGGSVRGLLYFDVSASAWLRLDRFEGEMYARQAVSVLADGGMRLPAWTYLVAPAFLHELSDEDWSFEEFLRVGKAKFRGEYGGFHNLCPDLRPDLRRS